MARPRPEASEWGKLSAGQSFHIIAVDVDRALSRAHLNDYETPLMQVIRERSWGTSARRKGGKAAPWPEPEAVPWRPSELALETGLPRNRLSEAKRDLVESMILIETTEGLMINKNADQWVFPSASLKAGKKRLDPAALVYAMAGRTRRETQDISEKSVRHSGHPSKFSCPEFRTEVSAIPDSGVRNSGQKCPPFRTPDLSPPYNPPIEERTNADSTRLDPKKSVPSEHTQEACACVEDRNGILVESDQGVKNDPAEVDRVADLAEDLFPGMSFDKHVLSYRKVWPIAWVEQALIEARAWANPPRTYSPIVNKLRGWTGQGGPPAAPPAAPPAVGRAEPAPRRSASLERQRLVREELRNTDWSSLMAKGDDRGPR